MRAMAQVCPYNGTVAVNIVIHAQFALGYQSFIFFPDIDRASSTASISPFIRLPCLFLTGLACNRARPALAGFDDALAMLFDLLISFGVKGCSTPKIVIETILCNRPMPSFASGYISQLLSGPWHARRMAHDRKAVFAVKRNGFSSIACMEGV